MSKIEYDGLGNIYAPSAFDGDVTMTLVEPSGNPLASNNTVDSTKPFDVKVTWTQDGAIAGFVGADWKVELAYDRIGGSWFEEGRAPASTTMNPRTVPGVSGTHTYTETFTVGIGQLPPGAYSLVVLVTHSAAPRLAGYAEIRPFQVF